MLPASFRCRHLSSSPPTNAHNLQIFFKMDRNGMGEELRYEDLPNNREISLVRPPCAVRRPSSQF